MFHFYCSAYTYIQYTVSLINLKIDENRFEYLKEKMLLRTRALLLLLIEV